MFFYKKPLKFFITRNTLKTDIFYKVFYNHLIGYPTPKSLTYFWGFGFSAGFFLAIQIITGIILAMHYTPSIKDAFLSIEHILRDVNYGWVFRYLHANGASFFFLIVYLHIARGLYYGSFGFLSFPVWTSGIIMFILMMAIAFMGYVLPWGQMSFWGATVITNLFSAIPIIGPDISQWLWGGFSVGNPTLNRFFSLHFTLPFILLAFVLVHLSLLHKKGSSNPVGNVAITDNVPFYPYFYTKDLVGFLCIFFIYIFFVGFAPNYLGHPDNYIEGNPLVTPAHIVPEWYFLPFYAILRAIPNKVLGVVAMGLSLIAFLLLPIVIQLNKFFIKTSYQYSYFYMIQNGFFFAVFIGLGWLGSQPVEDLYVIFGLLFTFYYFFFICFYIVMYFFQYLNYMLNVFFVWLNFNVQYIWFHSFLKYEILP